MSDFVADPWAAQSPTAAPAASPVADIVPPVAAPNSAPTPDPSFPTTLADGAQIDPSRAVNVNYSDGAYRDANGVYTPSNKGPGYFTDQNGGLFHVMGPSAPSAPQDTPTTASSDVVADPWSGQASSAPPQLPEQKPDEGLGLITGLMKPWNNAATWAQNAVGSIPIVGKPIEDAIGQGGQALGMAPNVGSAVANQKAYVDQQAQQGHTPGALGNFAGDVLGTLPAALATGNPFVGGLLSGALDTNNPNSFQDTGLAAAVGVAGGALGDAAMKAFGGLIAPKIGDAASALLGSGVRLTPGQILGGAAHRIEDGLSAVPIVGDLIKSAQRTSLTDWNRGLANEVLSDIGEKVPDTVATGSDSVAYAGNRLSQAYQDILPSLLVNADVPFAQDVASASNNASMLPPAQAQQFNAILDNWVRRPLQQGNLSMTGEAMKQSDSELGRLSAAYKGSADAGQRELGGRLGDVQSALRAMVERSNPENAAQLQAINSGWAKLTRLETAAATPGAAARGGVVTPANLLQAVRQGEKSVRKRGFARGEALMQDSALDAQSVLPSTVPDSGTATRGIIAGMVLGGGHAVHTLLNPATGVPLALGSAAYTGAGQSAIRAAILKRPPWAPMLSQGVAKLKPGAVAAGALLPQQVVQGLLPAPQ